MERKTDEGVDLIGGWEDDTHSTSTLADSFQSIVDLEEGEIRRRGGDEGQRVISRWSSKAARKSR